MEAGKKAEKSTVRVSGPTPQEAFGANLRNLRKNQLGGVIFGCTNSTLKECLVKQLFGLPFQHFRYVKNIEPGLPLFLFNYSDRRLHGIFEAASPGQMNINPYGWTKDASERTQYPAQVQICVRLQCQPLTEEQFKPIIGDNYYSPKHIWFELDHTQAGKLVNLLSSLAVAPSISLPQNTAKWRAIFQAKNPHDGKDPNGGSATSQAANYLEQQNWISSSSDASRRLDVEDHPVNSHLNGTSVEDDEKDMIYMKLKELSLNHQNPDLSLKTRVDDVLVLDDVQLEDASVLEAQAGSNTKIVSTPEFSIDIQYVIPQLIDRMEKLETSKKEQAEKMGILEQKLMEAEAEIQQLKEHCALLEPLRCPSLTSDTTIIETELSLDTNELIFLVGGYDGQSYVSSLVAYSPSQDVIKSLRPMDSIRSYASVAKLNDELYAFGGGNGSSWYDTVESYSLTNNQWTPRPSLNKKRGSLAGATLDNKIFAIGGGNGFDCFADVEMFDPDVGRWIGTRSMLQKRFALAAAELNGVLYAVGGYDGNDYLKSAERFDPREHSWTKIGNMNIKRGSHSVVVLNEKLYALGGFDGTAMVPSVEVYDPRLERWMCGEPMNQGRGYSAAAVVKDCIYIIGGVKDDGDCILETVEIYNESRGWEANNLRAVGKKGFCSAIVL